MKFLHGADYNHEQWLDRPEVLDQDFEAMEKAGCNTMTVGVFSWSKYQPQEGVWDFGWMDRLLDRLADRGMKAVFATPTAARPLWLAAAYPSTSMVDVQGHRAPAGGRHNHCRTSAEYRRLAVDINTRLADRYGRHPAVALWHVNNEYGSGRCYCPECLEAFRTWLKGRYGTLEAVNRAWWTDFWSHRYSDWSEIHPTDPSVTGLMFDWARFTSDQTLDFFLTESAPLRRLSPHIPITTNFHGPDVGLDYFAFGPHVDVASWDSYPRWHLEGDDAAVAARTAFHHSLVRSVKKEPFLLMESTPSQTNWQGTSPLKRPGLHLAASLQAVAQGSDSVQYFQWRQGRGGEETFHGSVLLADGRTDTRTFADVASVGRALAGLDDLAGTPCRSEAAVVLDFENHWALGLAQIPGNQKKNDWDEALAWHRALGRRGIGADVVGASDPFEGYRVVCAPMLAQVRPATAERLKAFVENGGTLVTGFLSGLLGDSLLTFEGGRPGPLGPLAGLRVEETDAVPAHRPQAFTWAPAGQAPRRWATRDYADLVVTEGAESVAVYENEFYAGRPVLTRHRVGKGTVWYLAARAEDAFLEAFLAEVCAEAGAAPAVTWAVPEGVEVRLRGSPGQERLFVVSFREDPVVLPLASGPLALEPYGWRLLTTW